MKTTIPSTIAPSLIAGLNHAALVTSDAAALAEFYCDVFDATALPVPGPTRLRISPAHPVLRQLRTRRRRDTRQ